MQYLWIVGGAGLLVGLYAAALPILRARRRKKLIRTPLPAGWQDILRQHVGLYVLLPEELRRELHGRIQVFLDEKRFEGCGGLEITDEIRVTVAAQACFLLLNRSTRYYSRLRSILVYPQDNESMAYQLYKHSRLRHLRKGMNRISKTSGGLALAVEPTDLVEAFLRVGEHLRGQYRLGYTSLARKSAPAERELHGGFALSHWALEDAPDAAEEVLKRLRVTARCIPAVA